jgi:hypothetical protein
MTTVTQITPKQSEQPTTSATPDLASLKIRQQAAWSSGNYAIVGTTLQIVGEELCEALDLRSGSRVLDVAAGNGMVTLRLVAGAMSPRLTMCPRCWKRGVRAPQRRACRSTS